MGSHTGHDHPATPAARAACRRAGGTPTPAPAPKAAQHRSQPAKPTAPRVMGIRAIRNDGDLATLEVPHKLAGHVRWAWSVGLQVTTGDVWDDDQKSIKIGPGAGHVVTLVWEPSPKVPGKGRMVACLRPIHTSVQTRLKTIDEVPNWLM